MKNGFVRFYRSEFKNPVFFHNHEAWALWSYLKMNATHKVYRVKFKSQSIDLSPGQIITTRDYLSKKLGIEQHKMERLLKALVSHGLITQESSTQGRLITVIDQSNSPPTETETE